MLSDVFHQNYVSTMTSPCDFYFHSEKTQYVTYMYVIMNYILDNKARKFIKYSLTCIKRSPLGQGKDGLIRQVTS